MAEGMGLPQACPKVKEKLCQHRKHQLPLLLERLSKLSWFKNCEEITFRGGTVFLSPESYEGEVYLVTKGFVSLGHRVRETGTSYLVQDAFLPEGAILPASTVLACSANGHTRRNAALFAWTSSKLMARIKVFSQEPLKIIVPNKYNAKIVSALSKFIPVTPDKHKYYVQNITRPDGSVCDVFGGETCLLAPEAELLGAQERTTLWKIPAAHVPELQKKIAWLNASSAFLEKELRVFTENREGKSWDRVQSLYLEDEKQSLLSPDQSLVFFGRDRLNLWLYGRSESPAVERELFKEHLENIGYRIATKEQAALSLSDELLQHAYELVYCRRGHQKEIVKIERQAVSLIEKPA